MYRYEGTETREKSKVISGETSLNLLAEERVCGLHIRELKQPRRRRRQESYKFAYLTMKTAVLHALHVQFSILDISQTFSFFLRREMTCFAVEWTT